MTHVLLLCGLLLAFLTGGLAFLAGWSVWGCIGIAVLAGNLTVGLMVAQALQNAAANESQADGGLNTI